MVEQTYIIIDKEKIFLFQSSIQHDRTILIVNVEGGVLGVTGEQGIEDQLKS